MDFGSCTKKMDRGATKALIVTELGLENEHKPRRPGNILDYSQDHTRKPDL